MTLKYTFENISVPGVEGAIDEINFAVPALVFGKQEKQEIMNALINKYVNMKVSIGNCSERDTITNS